MRRQPRQNYSTIQIERKEGLFQVSSSKDRIRDWFFHLSEETRNQIDDIVEQIREKEEFIETHEQSLRDLVRDLARMLEPLIDDSSQISIIIKAIANGRISDDTIERALPEDKKRKHKPYETYRQLEQNRLPDSQRPVTVSTNGSQSTTGPDGNEKEEVVEEEPEPLAFKPTDYSMYNGIAERSAEIALTTIDSLKEELVEKDTLLDDKDKRIRELELERGNFEIELGNLKNKPIPKNVDQLEELQIQLDEAKQTIEEYREIERKRVQVQDFQPASKVSSPPTVWIAAINLAGFIRALVGVSMKFDPRSLQRKVLFDVASDGQLKNPRPEGT
jgi:hypothetical protein